MREQSVRSDRVLASFAGGYPVQLLAAQRLAPNLYPARNEVSKFFEYRW
jgi:hypothetical protein